MSVKELRPFQMKGVTKTINVGHGSMLIWIPMGLGKSPVAATIAANLSARRIVINCRDSGIKVWTKRGTDPDIMTGLDWLVQQFHPLKVVVHNMDRYQPGEREYWWNILTPKDEVHIWVVVYNTLGRDMGQVNKEQKKRAKKKTPDRPIIQPPKLVHRQTRFDLIINDECKRISNTDSAGYLGVEKLRYDHFVPYIIHLSGTPGDKGPQSFFAYWRLIDRKKFSSYWAYIEHFHTIDTNYWGGKLIVEQRHDTKAEWDRLLDRYAYVVNEADVVDERPPLTRDKVYCELEPEQKKMYDEIRSEMLTELNGQVVVAQNSMVKFLRMRQILICPQMLVSDGPIGGAIKRFCDLMEEENEQGRRTVIFTPFTKAFEPWTSYLKYRGIKDIYHLQGGISANQQDDRITNWRKTGGVILNSIQYAEAYSLEPTTKAHFVGMEYSPDPNAQAERRLLRFTTKAAVWIGYYTYGTPTDERMVDIVGIKQEHIDFSKPSNLVALLKGDD